MSRRIFGKLLALLPEGLFVPYRCVVNRIVIDINRRRTQVLNSSLSSVDDESDTGEYLCCKNCHKVFYGDITPNSRTDEVKSADRELRAECEQVSSSVNIPTPPPLPDYSLFNSSTPPEDNNCMGKVSESGRITLSELGKVKLRPSTARKEQIKERLPETPDLADIYQILRKRYAAMHTPTPLMYSNDTEDTEEDSSLPMSRYKLEKQVLAF